jgi:hypothetical protein
MLQCLRSFLHDFVVSDGELVSEGCEEGCSAPAGVLGLNDSGKVKREMEQSHNLTVSTTEQVEMGVEKFKPGWRDIFRMNQKELEAAIRKVSSDSSLDPRRKAYLMQNLMTR